MSEIATVWPEYLRTKGEWVNISKVKVTGETSRSWLVGPEWIGDRREKYSKKNYEICTGADFEEQLWRDKHQYRIGQLVGNRIDPAILRQIAALIGYDPESK